MPKYIEKTEADLAWDEIRREVLARTHLAAANWRARKLNEILPRLQEQFEHHLLQGEILELEAGDWVEETLEVDEA